MHHYQLVEVYHIVIGLKIACSPGIKASYEGAFWSRVKLLAYRYSGISLHLVRWHCVSEITVMGIGL